MSYIIKNADGTVLTNLVDGTTDVKSTSLTLIGKNIDAYGTALNTNLVNILQNFASSSQPRNPLVGQLWFNKSDGRLKLYTLNGIFEEISAAILSNSQPTILKRGDLWIDTGNDQLYFTKDGVNVVLAGPIYKSSRGVSGWVPEVYIDDVGGTRSVTTLYTDGKIVGMLSTSSFIIAPINQVSDQGNQGMQNVTVGLTLNDQIPGIKFAGAATSADSVAGITPSLYLLKNNAGSDQTVTGTGRLTLNSDKGIMIGTYTDLSLYVSGGVSSRASSIQNNIADARTDIVTKRSDPPGADAFTRVITAYKDQVGINLNGQLPGTGINLQVEGTSYFHGDATITGNLTILGTQTQISSVILQIQDKNIELASSSTWYTDALVDGGGITLHGTTDKILYYHNSSTSWKSNIDWNINSGRAYKVSDLTVLTSSTLGVSVTQTSITRVGIMEELTVTNVIITGNGVTTRNASYGISTVNASGLSTGSTITVSLSVSVPILKSGATVTLDGIVDTNYNATYTITTVTNTITSSTFSVYSNGILSTVTPSLGATPTATFGDLMLSAYGDIDATGKRIKNLSYSTIPTDAATVQFAMDTAYIQSSAKGIAITLDISSMTNPNVEIAALLTQLAPPANPPLPPLYSSDTQYDLPLGYRARVLCTTIVVAVNNLPINTSINTTNVQSYPTGTPIAAITNISVTAGTLNAPTSFTYSVKEFRVVAGSPNYWQFYRNI